MKQQIIVEKTMSKAAAIRITELLYSFYKHYREKDFNDETNFPTIIVANEDVSDFYKNLYFHISLSFVPKKIRIPILHTISKEAAIALITEIYNEHKITDIQTV